jgi:lysyl-tRNA synthetase class 2
MPTTTSWWTPSRHADRRGLLLTRGRIKAAVRAWFENQGFVEVDTGCLQVSPGNETHLHAFKTELIGTDLGRQDLYLNTSPEFAMKKLLAAGEKKIFAFAPVFRNRERGPLHAPEFMMLEWYRAHADYETLCHDCAEILNVATAVTGRETWTWRGRNCNAVAPFKMTTVDDAFKDLANIHLNETYDDADVSREALASAAGDRDIQFTSSDSWGDLFSRILTDRIEPHLGSPQPEILCEYPLHEAALARPKPSDPRVAERFELYVSGVELANGFGELADAQVQRRRFEKWMDEKQRIYAERYPIDDDFLDALAAMPPASGCALGFDRLVMLATGATRVDQVIWTPLREPAEPQA